MTVLYPMKQQKVILKTLKCFSRTAGMSLEGYQVNYGGWYELFAAYLLKNHCFSLFWVILPPELTFLSPLRQQKFILVTLGCFSWTVGINLDGHLVNCGGLYNSFATYLLKNHDFSWFRVILPPWIDFFEPIKTKIVFSVTPDCFSWTEGINLDSYLVNNGSLYD